MEIIEVGELAIIHHINLERTVEERLKSYLQNFYAQIIAPFGQLKIDIQPNPKPQVSRYKVQFDKQFSQVITMEAPVSEYFQQVLNSNEDTSSIVMDENHMG